MSVIVTEEEKMLPEYRYFTRPMAEADPAQYARIENEPLLPEHALKIEDRNDLFREGYLPGEFGTCVLPNGTAVVANYLKMPGVTVEMFDWWFAWHGLRPIRYKLWDKYEHYDISTSDPEKRKNEALSYRERYWDTVDTAVEDNLGTGPRSIDIQFRNPADIGFNAEKLSKFHGTIVCAGGEHAPAVMCHFVRPIEGGTELRSRFWAGYGIKDGKPFKMLPDGQKIPEERGKLMLKHNIKEYTNLAAILPEIFEEFKNRF
ncbi:MAG: phloretin hydrolase [Eubacterium sp.]|jgi:hypothetical protein|nr:phloretin hydrolase [Eubacterium sp.]